MHMISHNMFTTRKLTQQYNISEHDYHDRRQRSLGAMLQRSHSKICQGNERVLLREYSLIWAEGALLRT